MSNALGWSPDNSKFYFGDTTENKIYSFDYDEAAGNISKGIKVLLIILEL